MKNGLLTIVIILIISSLLPAQMQDNSIYQFKGNHCIQLNLGLLNQANATVEGINVNAQSNYFGSMSYQYFTSNEWAVDISVSMLNAQASTGISWSGVETSSAAVIPILIGTKYYPSSFIFGDNIHPFFAVSLGVARGYSTITRASFPQLGVGTHNDSAFGSRIGSGLEVPVSNFVKLGAELGLNLFSDFKQPVGDRKNYSGLDFSASIALML